MVDEIEPRLAALRERMRVLRQLNRQLEADAYGISNPSDLYLVEHKIRENRDVIASLQLQIDALQKHRRQ